MKTNHLVLILLVSAVVALIVVASAHADATPKISGHVWLDDNANGVFDEAPTAGLEDVRVIFYRDYNCDGIINQNDEIFDYDYSGPDGYYFVVNAYYCYVGYLDASTIPAGLVYYTTDPFQAVQTNAQDVTDVNFGLSTHEKVYEVYNTVCPKPGNFWKKEFKKHVNFTEGELITIVDAALQLTPVFTSYDDIAAALKKNDDDDKDEKAERQFAALALNLAAAEVHKQVGLQIGLESTVAFSLPKQTHAASVGAAFDEVEGYLLSGSNITKALKIARSINKGESVTLNCN